MGRPLYTNNAASALAAGITSTQTTIQVQDGMGNLFPIPTGGDYFYVTLTSISIGGAFEIMQCTARSGDTMTVIRGVEGTSAQSFNIGDNVQLRITAAGMNFLSGSVVTNTQVQEFTATQGQTVFTLTNFDYAPATNNLAVFVNGSKQVAGVNYSETSVNVFTFTSGLNVGDVVEAIVGLTTAGGTINANDILYNEGGTGAVNRNVEQKLQESVSVLDFGAIGDGTTDDTAAIQAAHNASTAVYYPKGTYKISSSIVLPSGARVIGECSRSGGAIAPSTIVETTTSSYAYTMDAPVNTTIEGPRFSNIQINAQNGVRLNTTTGGQPGILGATQGFINNASFRKTFINQNGTNGTGTALQASVCFHMEFTEQSETLGFEYHLDIYYSDFVLISHCRLWQFSKALIRLTAANTFGSHSVIEYNDLLSGATGSTAFIICNDYNPTIRNNFIEQDATQGTGLTAAIIIQNNNQKFIIENNTITMPVACAPNWLNVTSTGKLGFVVITGNSLLGVGVGPALFNSGLGLQTFFDGGNGITVCSHWGNTFETGIPFNTKLRVDLPITTYKQVSNITPSLFGAIYTQDYGPSSYIKNNSLVIAPPTSGSNIVYLSDPDINITGNCAVYILAHADSAQTNTIAFFDNGIYMGVYANLSLTSTPTWFVGTASITPTTKLSINCTNASVGGVNFYVDAISIVRP